MKDCDHELCGREQYIWYPIHPWLSAEVKKHPYCVHCGQLKNISDDQPKKIGFWLDKVNMLGRELGVTQVQRRLISNEIKQLSDFDNSFGTMGSAQKMLFFKIFRKYVRCSERELDSWFDF